SRRRHTRFSRDWSSDVCSSDLPKYTIKMKLTPNTSFGTTNFETGNLSTVFSKVNHTHTFQGTQSMVFDSPFYWDGQSNILVEIRSEERRVGKESIYWWSP